MHWRLPFLVADPVNLGPAIFGAYLFLLDCVFNFIKFFLFKDLLVLQELFL